jgi:uncharacterized protein YgbK (DUF1537 family)
MNKLRLVADDLTGALDSAAQFAAPARVIPVFPNRALPEPLAGDLAVDAASREEDGPAAEEIAARLSAILEPGPGVVAFKKVDSLLRGHPGLEIAATLRVTRAPYCMIAPAFPFQGRVTRGGLQYFSGGGTWLRTGENLREILESRGVAVQLRTPGERAPEGVSLWDGETEDDLFRIASAGAGLPVLWCGSAGLAGALSLSAAPTVPLSRLSRPMLGIFGSDHPVTAAQLAACGGALRLCEPGVADVRRVSARIEKSGMCLVCIEPPRGLARGEAAGLIARGIAALTARIPMPRSLLVAGGETLRGLCTGLGADHLGAVGQVIPGVPVSVMVGGRWDGAQIVSKSGAFGDDGLLMRIFTGAAEGQNGSTPA